MKRVLVVGSTGYLGRFVVREMCRKGYRVRALARNPAKLDDLKDLIDEIFVGEVTDPKTLEGVCDGVDCVFSSLGITRQNDKVGYMDVDYQGNKNILDLAVASKVKKFIFVSILNPQLTHHLDIVAAREMIVGEIKKTGMDYTIMRPTGFFSDISEYFKMAKMGRVYLFGKGTNQINPIHGQDLAEACVQAVEKDEKEVLIGGPEVFSHETIATLAFSALGKPIKITRIPLWTTSLLAQALRPFSRKKYTAFDFMNIVMTSDMIGPVHGHHSLEGHFNSLVDEGTK